MKFFRNSFRPALAMLPLLASAAVLSAASPHEGRVLIGEVPVPGVVVTAVQGDKKVTAATNASGTYSFADLADGVWTIQIEMTGFAPVREDVTVSATGSTSTFALKMLPLTQIKTEPVNGFVASTAAPQLLQALFSSN